MLSATRKALGDLKGALAAIDCALIIAQFDLLALLTRAVLLDNLGDPQAGKAYRYALAQIRPGESIPPELQAAVAHARKRSDQYRKALEQFLTKDLPPDLTPAETARARRFITNRSRNTGHYHQEPCDFHFPGMPEIEFHDREMFPSLSALEQRTEVIRSEFDVLIAAEAAEMVPYVQCPDSVPLRQWK